MKESVTFCPWSRSCKFRLRINLLFSSLQTLRIEALEMEEKEAISLAGERWVEEEKDEEEDELAEESALPREMLGLADRKKQNI